eukprot:gene7480-11804_t
MPPAKKKPTREEIEELYHLPIAEAAQRLGICKTLLKQVCRKLNIEKWPYKKSKLNKKKTTPQEQSENDDGTPKETFRFRASPTSQLYKKRIKQYEPTQFVQSQGVHFSVPVVPVSSMQLSMYQPPIQQSRTQQLYPQFELIARPQPTRSFPPQGENQTSEQILPSFRELMDSVKM